MATSYDEVAALIRNSPAASFGTPDTGATDEWIAKAEARLGVSFPPSYKWWLKNYGGGEIGGEEILSIYGIDFDEAVGGDIVFQNTHRKLPPNCLLISDTGADEEFYFDTGKPDQDGEYPIMSFEHPDRETPYASNFLEFLQKRLEFFSRG
ncbi:MAG TPA: SMI1/KNR4 family protein [Thermoanaerobaculia bacterium]|jgi:hypothetical protein|nr:SMI1/KNR4 family protein [Thermoanaerobaculia bacterium]